MKILYLMHINWFWIRQRPHVFAELLAQRHDVMLLHYASYRRQHKALEQAPAMPSAEVLRVPGPLKRLSPAFEKLDTWWIEHQVRRAVRRFQPDCVWVLHPVYERATRRLAVCRIVYDCMDDHLEFVGQGTAQLAAAEQRLVKRADLCIFSSQTLARRVNARSPSNSTLVVNNAVSARFLQLAQQAEEASSMPLAAAPVEKPAGRPATMGYFGTVSHWFDWELVHRLLEDQPDAIFQFVGPLETPTPDHPRIRHLGILAHDALLGFAQGCDVLLMPFKVNRLIESVDPVKLYEYVALGIPGLAPRYAESERFEPFIHLYRSHDEALALVRSMLHGHNNEPDRSSALQFLKHNTWEVRSQQIDAALAVL